METRLKGQKRKRRYSRKKDSNTLWNFIAHFSGKLKNCPFGVYNTVEIKNITTKSDIPGAIDRWNITAKRKKLQLSHVEVYCWFVSSCKCGVWLRQWQRRGVLYAVILALFDWGHCWIITSISFTDMSLVQVDSFIQAVRSFCNY